MDGSGNIAVGYNVTSNSIGAVFPGLRYAGRLASDPPGTLPQGEATIVDGTASNSSSSYGNYSALSVDPVDDCTFWFTGEYNTNPGHTWSTRIATFKFSSCAPDLSITKTDGRATVEAASPVTYTITVSNAGPGAVTGATVNDTFPASLGGVTWTCTASAGSSCGTAGGSGNINHTVNLLGGGTAVFTATGTLDINASGTLSNTATVAPPGGTTDPNLLNNSATDNDTIIPAAQLSISDTSLLEGVGGTTTATFTVSLSRPSRQTVTVGYSTTDGTANAPSDYTAASCTPGTVIFAPGEVSQPISVTVFGDVVVEPDETFFVNLCSPTNAILAAGQKVGTGTIVNDDPPPLSAFAEFLILGQVHQTSVSNVTPTRWFKARLAAGRSYAASAWAPTTDPSESPVSLDVAWFLDDGATAAGGVSAVEREPIPDASGHNGDAESIIPTTAQCAVPSGCTYRVRLQGTGATTSIPVQVMIVETTMVSPYWQVATAAGYDAAAQIRNNTSSSVPVTFTAYDSMGSVVCSNTVTLPANGLTTFGISGAAPGCGIASGFGSAQIAFHGPPGSIAGNITTFSALSGLSFDSPFNPRNTWTNLRPN